MCPGPPVGAWAFPLGRSLRRLRWQAVAHRQSRCPRSISPNHSPGTAPGRIRGYQARKGLPPAAAKGAPVRGPFGGPRPTRPLRPAGRYPCPPWAAAWRRPPRLLSQSGTCGGQGRACGASRSSWPPAVARGHPSAMQGQAPAGRAVGPALHCSSPAPVAAQVLRRGPAPTKWGLWGRPRLRPGRAWLRPAAPRWPACGSACAGAALPALGPPGVAGPRPSRRPAAKPGRALRPAALPLRGPAILTPRARAAQVRPIRALRAAGARGSAACGRDGHACERRSRVKCTALRAALDRRSPARQRGTRRRGPLGPVTDPPPTERKDPT